MELIYSEIIEHLKKNNISYESLGKTEVLIHNSKLNLLFDDEERLDWVSCFEMNIRVYFAGGAVVVGDAVLHQQDCVELSSFNNVTEVVRVILLGGYRLELLSVEAQQDLCMFREPLIECLGGLCEIDL